MKALYFDTYLSLKELSRPKPAANEALIEVKAVGICNTDLEIIKGYMGFKGIPGHEFAGVVKECKDKRWLNKQVVGEINLGCGKCPMCRAGLKRHCPHRTVLGISHKDGAMAEFLTLPVENLHTLPEEIEFTTAIFVEPLAAACEILEQTHIKPEHRILVIGDGKLAALVAQVLSIINPHIAVVGKSARKVKLLIKLGVHADLEIKKDSSWDMIVECTGNPEGLKLALNYVKPRGTIILKSTYNQHISIDQNQIVVNELTLMGSRCGNFELAIEYLKRGLVKAKPLISKILPFNKYKQAFMLAQRPETLKIILEM